MATGHSTLSIMIKGSILINILLICDSTNFFKNNCRVLYVSLHRYDNGQFYPGTPDADYNFTGGPGAEGYNINVAWNWDTMGDAEYLAAFHYIIMPVAYEVNPSKIPK